MSLIGLKPFRGGSIRDVIQFLQVDVARAFADLFTLLGKIKLAEVFLATGTDEFVDFSATATEEDVAVLTLEPGEWTIFGTVVFHRNGATGTLEGNAWIGALSQSSAGTTLGLDRAQQQIMASDVYVTVNVMRRVTINKRSNVYLGASSAYSGSGPIQRLGTIRAIGRG